MNKSFLRVEDWAPILNTITNPCWLEILRIMDEFEKLVDTEKKEIIDCIKELTYRREQLIKQFDKYKNSLRYSGQVKKEVLAFNDSDMGKNFFMGYYALIEEIVNKVVAKPSLLARMLGSMAKNSGKKYDNPDFVQSILYHIYPCHIPLQVKSSEPSHCMQFVEEIINQWSYDIKQGRPSSYTIIDQIINGFTKTPEIVCYVQKISINFMKKISECNMDFFAFDEDAIKHEFQLKRSMRMSQLEPKPKKWGIFSIFSKKEQKLLDHHSATSQGSDPADLDFNVNDIMKQRQKQFMQVIKQTIQVILGQETPCLLNQMFKFFHNKIHKEILKAKQKQPTFQKGPQQYYRHYCYFLMTNLICEELHNKFTISHEDTGMKPADLQNITEIIKIITQIFQNHKPQGNKYKNQKLIKQLDCFHDTVPLFYAKMLAKGSYQQSEIQQKPKLVVDVEESEKIREILLQIHQNTVIVSFNDIRAILDVIRGSNLIQELNLSDRAKKMEFLQDKKINQIYKPTTRKVQFKNQKHDVDKIFFVFNSTKPHIREVVQFYVGSESPLKDLPLLTKSLMYGSNLNVTEALEVTKSLQLMQSLSLKEVKYFLSKIAIKYSNLYLRDSQILSDKFRETIQRNLTKNIRRKSVLILQREEICSRINFNDKLINFYTEELRSSQFYDRISETFIHNIKIKAYMKIENDQLKIYQTTNEMNGVVLQTFLMTKDSEREKRLSDDYLLRTSFKSFSTILDLLKTISKNSITKSALSTGRRVEEFNEMFTKLCSIVVSYIEEFLKKRQILQNLNKDKLAKTIVSKIQNFIYKSRGTKTDVQLESDKDLIKAKDTINVDLFFEKDLKELNADWQFLENEGKKKFKLMMEQKSIQERTWHFDQLFKMVFTILRFSMSNNKITAQIINPVIQYLILKSDVTKNYQCLYSLQAFKWSISPQTCYNIILYESSLTYVSKMMSKDYPKFS